MDTSTLPGIGIKPLLSIRRHWRAGLAAALLVVLAGLPFTWIKGRSNWTAEAVFQVAPSYMKNLEVDKELELQSNSQYREYVNHLASSVTRDDVLERALAELAARGIHTRPSALTERRYLEQLKRTLYVRAIPDTYMVRIGIEDTDRTYLDAIVNAVTDSFLKTTRVEQIYGSGDRLALLKETAARLRSEVETMELERVALADRLGLTTFGEGTQNPYDSTLAQTRERLAAATTERVQAEAALAAFDRQREVPTSFAGRSLLEMRLQDNGLQALRNEVVRRREELNRTIAGLEPKHPARQAAIVELAAIEGRLTAAESDFDRETATNFRARLVTTLGQRNQVEKALQASLRQLEGQAIDFARDFQRAMHLTNEIRKRDAERGKLRDRLNYLDTESNALGFVRPVSWARMPEIPSGVGRTRLFLAVLAAAAVLGLAVPIALDLIDRRIRSVNDAERLLGIPAAGWQVRTEDLPTQLFAEEQARRFASTLMRNRARSDRRTFTFTSIKPGGGVTTGILDTARVLVRLGARVLVVEANAFAPFAGFPAGAPGLSDYLSGQAELSDLPRPFHWRGETIDVATIGEKVDGGLRRLDRLQLAMSEWSASYDYVLVDLPPLLLSADAEMLIDALGQVFLVLEAEAVTRGEIARAKRLLQNIDPDAVGLFVSKVPVFHGAGYMERLMVEALTRRRFEHFMSLPRWKLWWEARRARLATTRA